MEDQSLFNSSQPKGISEGLQNFINVMVEEIVLEGKPFDTQKKYLKKFSENEGLNYEKLEIDIMTFIEIMSNLKAAPDKLMEKFAEEKGRDCYLSDNLVRALVTSASQKVRHVVPKLNRNEIDSYYYFADWDGNSVIPGKWVDAWEFSEGLAAVAKSIPGEKF